MADFGDILSYASDPADFSGYRAGEAANEAADRQAAYNKQAMDAQQAMYDQTRTDMLPFLQAATGQQTQYDAYNQQLQDIANQFLIKEQSNLGWLEQDPNWTGSTDDVLRVLASGDMGQGFNERWSPQMMEVRQLQEKIAAMGDPSQFQPGALQQYQEGLDGAPVAPELGSFDFDVTKVLDNPAMQFQMQQGEKALDRLAGKNRQLGSGNRLYDLVNYNQGLTSTYMNDEYGRQRDMFDTNQNVDLKNYGMASDRYNTRMNRLAGLIDVGRGTGSAMGSLGQNTASGISGLLNNTGTGYAAASLAPYNAQQQGVNTAATVLGTMYGGPLGGAAANTITSPNPISISPQNDFMNPNILSNQNIGFY